MRLRRSENKNLGRKGERLAEEFLVRHGYRVIDRNYRTRRGEIDIVCERGGCVVFVEVKTRRNLAFGQPQEAVDARKRRKMLQIATSYLAQKSLGGKRDCRFDVITILEENPRVITHFEDAFRP